MRFDNDPKIDRAIRAALGLNPDLPNTPSPAERAAQARKRVKWVVSVEGDSRAA